MQCLENLLMKHVDKYFSSAHVNSLTTHMWKNLVLMLWLESGPNVVAEIWS